MEVSACSSSSLSVLEVCRLHLCSQATPFCFPATCFGFGHTDCMDVLCELRQALLFGEYAIKDCGSQRVRCTCSLVVPLGALLDEVDDAAVPNRRQTSNFQTRGDAVSHSTAPHTSIEPANLRWLAARHQGLQRLPLSPTPHTPTPPPLLFVCPRTAICVRRVTNLGTGGDAATRRGRTWWSCWTR